mmetsp:Transcript_21136/g.61001  ORF Transcript_21136/g.61001 Transcript_21136/m.61001 type:complete len:457 (-) Transcript_21136:87-1457(-)
MWVVLNSRSTSWNPVERLIFPAPSASYDLQSFPEELIFIPRADGEKVPCLLLPFRHARFLVIYFHANAEDLGLCYSFCKIMRDLFQVHVLAVEYPGYGLCTGKTDEDGIMANAMAAMRFATDELRWPCDGIKLFGRSLGTGPAVALATQHEVAGLILVSPFTSIRDLFRSQVGVLAELVDNRFRNQELAAKIESPTLIVHGQQDTLIPLDHGKRVYEALITRKMMVCPATMGHNTSLLKSIGTFVLPMTQFFSLPDYTFEDMEVPAWVYPSGKRPAPRDGDLAGGSSQRASSADAQRGAAFEPPPAARPVMPQPLISARSEPGPRHEAGEEAPSHVAQRPKLSPRASLRGPGSAAAPPGLVVSRGYDFNTKTRGPGRASAPAVSMVPRPAREVPRAGSPGRGERPEAASPQQGAPQGQRAVPKLTNLISIQEGRHPPRGAQSARGPGEGPASAFAL